MQYWLMKTEPSAFSIDDLQVKGTEPWDGIRNYQARNFMRDQMVIGDKVFIYHSREEPIGIAGEAEIASAPYPDSTQFNQNSKYFDPKSAPDQPRWMLVDVKFVRKYPRVISLAELKQTPGLENMVVTRKGSRLSIQPVSQQEWSVITQLADESC